MPKFKDASGDGQGDLGGVLSKLVYIKELGANFLVLSPILKGLGRMVNSLTAIDPRVGNEMDFNNFLEKAHEAGFKVLLEYSPNYACSTLAGNLKIPPLEFYTNFANVPTNFVRSTF